VVSIEDFVTAQPHLHGSASAMRIDRRALWVVEDAAASCRTCRSRNALQLAHLYSERGSPKSEPAARRWLARYLTEGTPSIRDVAKVTASLARHSPR
jgi:hypothetical protein